jgi:hypothetical protein
MNRRNKRIRIGVIVERSWKMLSLEEKRKMMRKRNQKRKKKRRRKKKKKKKKKISESRVCCELCQRPCAENF